MPPTAAATQVAELVRALALGWKNLTAYPPGHPALSSSLQLVHRRLNELRGSAKEVTLGIAKDALLYGDEKIESTTAQKFAQALFMRGVAVLRFSRQTEAQDIEVFLRMLASPADDMHPIWDELSAAGVTHITLQPVDYSQVRATDDLNAIEEQQPSLWEDILRALMEGQELSKEAQAFLAKEGQSVNELVRMILQHIDDTSAKPAFDPDATFGIRMPLQDAKASSHAKIADAVGNYISASKGTKRESALRQAIDFLRGLPQPLRGTVLRKITEVLATDPSAAAELRKLATELPHEEIIEALRHLSTMTNLSPHALTLLQSLTAMQSSTRAEPPTESVIADLVRIFGEDDIDRFNPPDHTALLEQVSIHVPHVSAAVMPIETLGRRTETVADSAIKRQLGRTLLDLLPAIGAVMTPRPILTRIETLFASHLTGGEIDEAFELTQRLNEIASAATVRDELRHAIHESIGNLASPDMIRALIDSLQNAPPEKTRVLVRLIDSLGSAARRNLLIALSEENNRSRRRKLFDFITSLGPVIAPEALSFLNDDRWYVLRNMIVILRSVNDRTSLSELRKLAHHRDLHVRVEAIKSLFALDSSVPTDLLENLIDDPDPKVAETAITLVGSAGIREGVGPLLRLVRGTDIFGSRRSLRIKAIRALGDLGDPSSLPGLRRFLRDSILPWPSKEERLAAWESLAGYPSEARGDIVERGARSRDPQVREICERMQ